MGNDYRHVYGKVDRNKEKVGDGGRTLSPPSSAPPPRTIGEPVHAIAGPSFPVPPPGHQIALMLGLTHRPFACGPHRPAGGDAGAATVSTVWSRRSEPQGGAAPEGRCQWESDEPVRFRRSHDQLEYATVAMYLNPLNMRPRQSHQCHTPAFSADFLAAALSPAYCHVGVGREADLPFCCPAVPFPVSADTASCVADAALCEADKTFCMAESTFPPSATPQQPGSKYRAPAEWERKADKSGDEGVGPGQMPTIPVARFRAAHVALAGSCDSSSRSADTVGAGELGNS
eukprot:gene17115-biopygen8059